jgi:hypothetical protein
MDEPTSGDHGYDQGGNEEPAPEGPERPPYDPAVDGPWTHRVVFAPRPGGGTFAFRPEQVLSTGGRKAIAIARRMGNPYADSTREIGGFRLIDRVDDPLRTVAELRMRGFMAQPNYVYFAQCGCGGGCGSGDGCRCGGGCGGGCGSGAGGCPPHPSHIWTGSTQSVHPTPYATQSVHPTPYGAQSVHPTPLGAQSVHPTPSGQSVHPTPHGACCCCGGGAAQSVHPTPHRSQSVHPTPYSVSSVHPTPFDVTSVHPTPRRSSARPLPPDRDTGPIVKVFEKQSVEHGATVIVLDTGLAADPEFPPHLAGPAITAAQPVLANSDFADRFPNPADKLLDEVAGHGTFIAGVVQQVAPGCGISIHKVLASWGDTDDATVAQRLAELPGLVADPARTIVSLSFGGYLPELPVLLAGVVAQLQEQGVVVVAAAGNDGTCQPMYPAALPAVGSVGAIGPDGPAPFTNYGPWVRACAPGVDVLSSFFVWDGATPPAGQGDPDKFDGWALWSGTSFSAPAVAGALARTVMGEGCTAKEAVVRVVDNPSLLRLPGLGTVVNVI